MIKARSARDIIAGPRRGHSLGKLQNRRIAMSGFVGSPAHCWSHFFLFPPLPAELEGHKIPDARQVSLELLVERFGPVWDACKKYGVTFDLECHPSERAMRDIQSATDYITFMNKAGYEDVDRSTLARPHMHRQGPSAPQSAPPLDHPIHSPHPHTHPL